MIKVLYIAIVLLFILNLSAAEQQKGLDIYSTDLGVWELLEIPYDSMLCRDIMKFNDTIFVSTENKGILYSTNEGDKWELFNKVLEEKGVRPHDLYRNMNVFASILEGNYRFIISSDGGKTWNEGSFLWPPFDTNPPINDGLVFEDKFILATDRGLLFTTDFGVSWQNFQGGDLDSGAHTSKIMKDEQDNMYVSTLKGLLKSDDNGVSWEIIISKQEQIWAYLKLENGYIYGYNSNYNIVRTNNYGLTWNLIGEAVKDFYAAQNFLNIGNSLVVIVGGGVAVSNDGGESIVEYYLPFKKPNGSPYVFFNAIRNGEYIIAATEMGILRAKLSDLGIETITSVESEIEKNYLYTLPPYPLPAKSVVKVLFYWDINLPMTVDDISIYDLSGRKIQTSGNLRFEKEASHKGNIIWDCSSAQPGVYIISIKHGTEEKSVKVIVE